MLGRHWQQETLGHPVPQEKSRAGQKQLAVRWMTPKQAELAQAAIEETRSLTAAARKRATALECHPDRVTLPGVFGNPLL